MGKKRASKKVRPQEYPDDDEMQDVREKWFPEETEEPAPVRPKREYKPVPASCQFREGDTVTCVNKNPYDNNAQATGTIIMLMGSDALVLDGQGFLHHVRQHEVYPAQK
jgi:hypothetical protein